MYKIKIFLKYGSIEKITDEPINFLNYVKENFDVMYYELYEGGYLIWCSKISQKEFLL